jgi:riboflavin synthase
VFTGLVEEKGSIARREARGPGARLAVRCSLGRDEALVMGESISVSGCCLSVVGIDGDVFEVDASAETLAKTTLGDLAVGAAVNLERAAKIGDRIGGHLVTGHVDGVGTVLSRRQLGDAWEVAFRVPHELARYVAPKGCISIDGVSLTVNGVRGDEFDVVIIPVTAEVTTFGEAAPGRRVNLEVDLVARYVARLLESESKSK